jgi:ATP-binding cassette subfamily F protein 3
MLGNMNLAAPMIGRTDAQNLLGLFGFTGRDPERLVGTLSGGERRRLLMAMALTGADNVLLLDEPTNHLDLEMREALAEALSLFEGAIVMVSHDRHLIGLVCETYWRVSDGVVEPFDGDLDEYAAWLRSRASAQGNKPPKIPETPLPAVAAAKPAESAKKVNPHKLAQAEARVAELETQLAALETELADPAVYAQGGARVAEIGRQQTQLRDQLATAEAEWSALYD